MTIEVSDAMDRLSGGDGNVTSEVGAKVTYHWTLVRQVAQRLGISSASANMAFAAIKEAGLVGAVLTRSEKAIRAASDLVIERYPYAFEPVPFKAAVSIMRWAIIRIGNAEKARHAFNIAAKKLREEREAGS